MTEEKMQEEKRDWSPIFEILGVNARKAKAIKEETPDAKKRFEAFRHDIAGFLRYYFPEYISLEPPEFQKALFSIFENPFRDKRGKWKFKVTREQADRLRKYHRTEFEHLPQELDIMRGLALCAPRETGKSTVFARLLLIYLAIYGYIHYVVYIRGNSTLAEDFLSDTMSEFETNERLINDYGNLKGSVWTKDKYSLKNGIVFVALGRGANVRGLVKKNHRPDFIIMDDVTSDQDKNSPRVLDSIYDWIVSAIFGLAKDATILYLNTIFNEVDPMYRIQERTVEGTLPRWLSCRFSAEIDSSHALWPELWPLEELAFKKKEVGSEIYELEYMSTVTSGKGKILPRGIFQKVDPLEVDTSDMDIRFGVDPNAEGTDDAAICVTGKYWSSERYVTLDCWERDGASVTELVDELVRLNAKWRPSAIAFESNGFQNVYRKTLMEVLAEDGIALPLVGVEARGSKAARATAIQAHFENGLWQILDELLETGFFRKIFYFPAKGLNDGPVDALELSYQAFHRDIGKATGRVPKRSSMLPGIIGRYRNGR